MAKVDALATAEPKRHDPLAAKLADFCRRLHEIHSELHAEWCARESEEAIGGTVRAELSQASTLLHLAMYRIGAGRLRLARQGRR